MLNDECIAIAFRESNANNTPGSALRTGVFIREITERNGISPPCDARGGMSVDCAQAHFTLFCGNKFGFV